MCTVIFQSSRKGHTYEIMGAASLCYYYYGACQPTYSLHYHLCTHTHKHTHIRTHTHSLTHTHTHTLTHSHTHKHRLKSQVASKYALPNQPRLVDIIAAVPQAYKKALLPKLRAKPVRTASGIAVVAVMCKPHRCPHITFTGNICV